MDEPLRTHATQKQNFQTAYEQILLACMHPLRTWRRHQLIKELRRDAQEIKRGNIKNFDTLLKL